MSEHHPAGSLHGVTVVLGVSGGIAAYKSVELCRAMIAEGATVLPVMTKAAHRFIGATTLSALASEPVQDALFGADDVIPHTRLGQRADVVVIAPATATLIAKYAAGIGDDLLTATLLATRAPVIVAPAMHTEMWEHPATAYNIALLVERGVSVVEPETGILAGGDIGAGRLASTDSILATVLRCVNSAQLRDLAGQHVVVTAGGTREPIDPVRVIANRSSGKMGYAVAEAAVRRGAKVTLISTVERPAPFGVEVIGVETAEELRSAVLALTPTAQVIVMAAAVADFRPKASADCKLKKKDGLPEIILEPTPDILAELGAMPAHARPVLVGFAAETAELLANATEKLRAKSLDWLVANDVSAADAGFQVDTNRVILLDSAGRVEELPL
ncbi:MAG: bifunctional phosphopantothenoylcysteine decarboxylase/phosphopantothenate--cysteine ligase CoaBC, partial [Acidimicrobiia bacterium]